MSTITGTLAVVMALSGFSQFVFPQQAAFSSLPLDARCLAVIARTVPFRGPEGPFRRGCPHPFDNTSFLIVPDAERPTRLTVEAGFIGTVGGLWTSTGAHVEAEGALSGSVRVIRIGPRGFWSVFQPGAGFRPEADWGNTIWGGRYYTVTPSFEIGIQLNHPDLHHKWITLQTSMSVAYPSSNYPGGGFSNASQTMKRTIRLLLISEADKEYVPVGGLPIAVSAAALGAVLLLTPFLIRRRRAFQRHVE